MRAILTAALIGALITSGAEARNDTISAQGTLYVTYNMGVGSDTERKLSARFVPDRAALSAPPGSPEPLQPVRHFNIDNPRKIVNSLLGKQEMSRLSKDPLRIVAVPVNATLSNRTRVMECDAPADYATLLSANALGQVRQVSREVSPIGC